MMDQKDETIEGMRMEIERLALMLCDAQNQLHELQAL